jgi:putative GTP pyrophosphokinase
MASLDFEVEKTAFRDYYNENQALIHEAENTFKNLLSSLLIQAPLESSPKIQSRVKDREECITKFILKYQSYLEDAKLKYEIKDHITDLIGIRIICLYEDEVKIIGDVIDRQSRTLELTDKSAEIEDTDGEFGYKGLHLDIKINADRIKLPEYAQISPFRAEVQIRTIVQDAWSTLDHKIKYKKSIPKKLKRRIVALAAQFEQIDREFVSVRDDSKSMELVAAKAEGTIEKSKTPLTAFEFPTILKKHRLDYVFSPYAIDGFVAEILERKSSFSARDLDNAIEQWSETIDNYKKFCALDMNPYTTVRHVLYISDPKAFGLMLFDRQRSNFDAWTKSG